MINIFYVEAPFQYISAVNAVETEKHKKNIIILRTNGNEINDGQVKFLLSENKYNIWDGVLEIGNNSILLSVFKILFLKTRISLSRNKIDVFALGDYRSKVGSIVYSLFHGRSLWFLDDGIANLNLFKYKNNKFVFNSERIEEGSLRVVKKYLLQNNPRPIVLKTFLNLEVSYPFVVEKNDLPTVFKKYKRSEQTINSDLVYFVGSKLIDEGLVSEAEYHIICENVSLVFKNKKIVYFAHRGESDIQINMIRKKHNFITVRPTVPIEQFVCNDYILPSSFVGILSAALFTLSEIYPQISTCIVDTNNYNINHEFKSAMATCIEYAKKNDSFVFI